MDDLVRGARCAVVHGVTKSQTELSDEQQQIPNNNNSFCCISDIFIIKNSFKICLKSITLLLVSLLTLYKGRN